MGDVQGGYDDDAELSPLPTRKRLKKSVHYACERPVLNLAGRNNGTSDLPLSHIGTAKSAAPPKPTLPRKSRLSRLRRADGRGMPSSCAPLVL